MPHHKKQHYIPACYLKAWCDENTPKGHTPYVWIFDADGSNSRRKSPEKIFYESDMYTIEGKEGNRDLVLEHGLSQLEETFSRIRRKTLAAKRAINETERLLLCAFIASMHTRTPARREHLREQWERPLRMMEGLNEWLSKATPEELSLARTPSLSSVESKKSISFEQVKEIYENPIRTTLRVTIRTLTPLLAKLDMAIIEAPKESPFITSDNPCVWFDAAAYKRPPMFQSPALMYKTIEITLPISPHQIIWLNRAGIIGYEKANVLVVDELNRRTRFLAHGYFVSDRNETKPYWFDRGVEPDDSWEKTHGRGTKETDSD